MNRDPARDDLARRVELVHPELTDSVYTEAEYTGLYLAPYRTRTLKALEKFEKKHQTLFCRSCTKKHPKGFMLFYRLWIEVQDNLLENKKDDWINLQCHHCDFEMNMERPKNESVTDKQIQELQRIMQQQQIQAGQANQLAGGGLLGGFGQGQASQAMQQAQYEQDRLRHEIEEQRRRAAMTASPPMIGKGHSKWNPFK